MKVCAVIAEFNPLHNGHKHLIQSIKEKGYSHIVVIMSGNYVQRGEPAILSKESRTKMALSAGVNLVVELPTWKTLSTAQKYACAGIQLVKSMECVDSLAFGMESENIGNLETIKNAFQNPNFKSRLKCFLDKGLTFAKARENALKDIISDSEIIQDIRHPNNILAIEYLCALEKCNITPLSFKRMTSPDSYRSASDIRRLINLKDNTFEKYIPSESRKFVSCPIQFPISEKLILFKLRGLNISQISNLPDISEGLENRIYDAIKKSCTVEELILNIKTKRYTMSRIKRILLCALLDINLSIAETPMRYIRLLGSDKKGFDLLRNTSLPVVTRFKDVSYLNSEAQRLFEIENKCTNLYNSLKTEVLPCETEKNFKFIKGWEL